jgi:hypothetical protein
VNEPGPFVLILGMHRSGTSCLAGCLEQCGLFLGEVRRTGRFNSKGYYELAALTRLHDEILAANGGAWDAPPERVRVGPNHQHALQQFADLYMHQRPCGLKDPRFLLLHDVWMPLLPQATCLVGTFRHPVAVSRSLTARNNLTPTRAIDLWVHYNSELVSRHRARPFPLVSYDLNAPDAYCRTIAILAARIGLRCDPVTLEEFVDARLEHQRRSDVAVPVSCRALYDYLCEHSSQPSIAALPLARPSRPTPQTPDQPSADIARRVASRGLRAIRSVRRHLKRLLHRRRARDTDLSELRTLLIFVGNARCGTTLVRTLLDTHPRVVLGNEVDLLRRRREGEDWQTIVGRILDSARCFRRRPVWEGYSYQAGAIDPARMTLPALIVGDKKAGATARALMQDILLLDEIREWSPVEVRVLHCVRNPFDVIATKTRRNARSLQWNIERYFDTEQTAAYLHDRLGPSQIQCVFLEALIGAPRRTLEELLAFLGLEADPRYLDCCESLVRTRPHRTRDLREWPHESLGEIARRTANCAHLARYLTPQGLAFADTEIDTYRQATVQTG